MLLAAETPTWLTLVTGIGIGGVFGTLLTVNHERGAEFRTRMLNASDEFLQTLATAAYRLGDLSTVVYGEDPSEEEVELAFERANQARDDVLLQVTRLGLLFDQGSRTYQTAYAADTAIDEMIARRRDRWDGLEGAEERFDTANASFVENVDNFGPNARRDVRRTGLFRRT